MKQIIIFTLSLFLFVSPVKVIADEINNEEKTYTKEELEFLQPFRINFDSEIKPIEEDDKIILDGKMDDWANAPFIQDVDKYGPHTEDITGIKYYIDKKPDINGKQFLYLNISVKNTRVNHVRVWAVTNKNTFETFMDKYNKGGGQETGLISLLENDKAGVISYSANVERLTSSEPIRVQVLNHNASSFKEQGYWFDESSNSFEFRIPLDSLLDVDGTSNFDLVIGTDLYNWPTADFNIISISGGSTAPYILALVIIVVAIFIYRNSMKRKLSKKV